MCCGPGQQVGDGGAERDGDAGLVEVGPDALPHALERTGEIDLGDRPLGEIGEGRVSEVQRLQRSVAEGADPPQPASNKPRMSSSVSAPDSAPSASTTSANSAALRALSSMTFSSIVPVET